MNTKEIKEQRASLIREMQELASVAQKESRSFTSDEQEKFDKLDTESQSLHQRAETLERVEKVNKLVMPEVASSPSYRSGKLSYADQNNALRCFFLRAAGHDHLIKDEWRNAADKSGMTYGNTLNVKLESRATAGQNIADSIDGGYAVNGGVVVGIEKALKAFGGVTSVCRVLRTENGSPISYATCDDTSNVGALVAENASLSNTALVYGQVSLGAYKFSSLVQPVSLELLQDSAVDIAGHISESLGLRLARVHNTYGTTGTGTGQPKGVVVGSALGKTAAATGAVTAAELIDLYHSVDVAYRNLPGTAFMMNDATYAAVRKLTASGSGEFIWGMGLNAGGPDQLLGKPVVINNDMDTLAAAKKVILFGNFPMSYIWRQVLDINIRVLNERYIDNGAVGFVAFSRCDGNTINANAVKHLITAAS